MQIIDKNGWIYYIRSQEAMEDLSYCDEVGKWLIFFKNKEFAETVCKSVIEDKIIIAAKHSKVLDKYNSGVCCLYLDGEDYKSHKKLISYLLKNNYLPRNKNGSYTNIAFKHDYDTFMGIYEYSSSRSLHLKEFIDLKTGKWSNELNEKTNAQKIEKTIVYKVCDYFNSSSHWGNRNSWGWMKFNGKDKFNFEYVNEYIKKNNIKVKDLANKLEVSEVTVRNWLNGKSRPFVWNAIAICVWLNLDENKVIIKNKL